jgi:glycine hydroxymethyltransferase
MAAEFLTRGYKIVSGGTDNHLFVLDLSSKGLAGKEAEMVWEKIGISVSRSTIPNDPNPPMNPSGVRIGVPAITTRGLKEKEVCQVAVFMDEALQNRADEVKLNSLKEEIKKICETFPIPTK